MMVRKCDVFTMVKKRLPTSFNAVVVDEEGLEEWVEENG
jgi:hypothetical protein